MNYHKLNVQQRQWCERELYPQLYHRPVSISDLKTHLKLHEELKRISIFFHIFLSAKSST